MTKCNDLTIKSLDLELAKANTIGRLEADPSYGLRVHLMVGCTNGDAIGEIELAKDTCRNIGNGVIGKSFKIAKGYVYCEKEP